MPEEPRQSRYIFRRRGDLDGVENTSLQRRLETRMGRMMDTIPEGSESDLVSDNDAPPPSESSPVITGDIVPISSAHVSVTMADITESSSAAADSVASGDRADRIIVDEMDEEDDVDEDDEEEDDEMAYPCPYCYVEFKMIPLCHHLAHDHYDEADETVCTICADRITGDMLQHITTGHEQLFKMAIEQSRSRIITNPTSQELSQLSSDLQAMHLNTPADNGGQSSSSGLTDPLLSSLVTSCAEDLPREIEPAQNIWQSSSDSSLSSEEQEERIRQAAGRAAFVQDLVCSTMFLD